MSNLARTLAALVDGGSGESYILMVRPAGAESPRHRAFEARVAGLENGTIDPSPLFTADLGLALVGFGASARDALVALEVVCSAPAHLEELDLSGF